MLSSDAIASRVNELDRAWSMKYRDDFHREKPETLFDANKTYVNKQIKFIGLYLGHMLVDSMASQNYVRIKRFLSKQKVVTDRSNMVLRFIGGTPPEVVVIVKNLNDVDLVYVYGITRFKEIYAIKGGRKWTCKSATRFIKSLKNNLAFDYGYAGKFKYEYDMDELNVECSLKSL